MVTEGNAHGAIPLFILRTPKPSPLGKGDRAAVDEGTPSPLRRCRQHAHWQQRGHSSYPSLRIEQSGKSPILSQSLGTAPSADTLVAQGLMWLNHENRFRAAPDTTHAGFAPARIPGAVLSHIRHGPPIFRRTPANIAAGGTGRTRTDSLPMPSPWEGGPRSCGRGKPLSRICVPQLVPAGRLPSFRCVTGLSPSPIRLSGLPCV